MTDFLHDFRNRLWLRGFICHPAYITYRRHEMKTELSESAKRKVVERFGVMYRRALKRMDILENTGCICEDAAGYRSEADLVFLVNRALEDCSQDTQCIIKNEYLKVSDPYWYEQYYTRSTYYRLKREAVDEFVESLDI